MKVGGSGRFYKDHRQLKELTVKDKFPIPLIDDHLDELNRAKILSKIDTRAAYHQSK